MTAPRPVGHPGSPRPGSRVRLRPGRRGDIFDLALAGRLAEVDAVEEDSEGHSHIVVTLVDDDGRDFPTGLGHRFFFAPDEVEPVGAPSPGRPRVLVAATGDSFATDGAFGSALLTALRTLPLPEEVHLVDFGLRGADLAHRLLTGYGSAVVVGTASLGRPAGAGTRRPTTRRACARERAPAHRARVRGGRGGGAAAGGTPRQPVRRTTFRTTSPGNSVTSPRLPSGECAMKNGIFIPAIAVRITVGVLAAAALTAMAFSAPDAVRYIKMEMM
ncbi:hypothetical protein AB0G35_12370 [Streptomyces sp. NPDC021749]|uniref:hypothetical protein n=1 Tax=Streptomyces sp. NPDC021749 TaxID=3154905 RepID=UPI0033EBABCB